MEREIRPTAEGSSARTAYAFLRPLPSQRVALSASAMSSPGVGLALREDMLRKLFPSRTQAGDDSEGSLSVAGAVVGHFQIQERIGRGGMGAVFRAVDLRLDRIVALKVLSPEQSYDAASVQRFQNEARAAAKLDHDNIAQVYFIGEDQGLHFISFEFITGTNVRELLARKGVIPVPDAVSYVIQIAEALRSTAAVGVVHRDIKPSNIIIEPTGRVTLVDLGLARQSSRDGEELTVAGTTLGTFDYISPEQAMDPRKVDVRSDIYSLGCTAYHMVTGEPPYPSSSMFQKVVDHHGSIAPDAAAKNASVPPKLAAIIRKMMASDPDGRYATPEALIRDLQPVARALGIRPVQTGWEARPQPRNWFREHRGWIASAVAVVLIGLGINKLPVAPERSVRIDSSSVELGTGPDQTPTPASSSLSELPRTPLPPDSPTSIQSDTSPGVDAARLDTTQKSRPSSQVATGVGAAKGELTGAFAVPGKIIEGDGSPMPVPVVLRESVFWISGNGIKERSFPTLEAACTSAPDGATIEIRADGPIAEAQGPVRIDRKHLKIRPAAGFRPRIEFKDIVSGPVPPSRWFTVTSGSLEVAECDLVMRVPATRSSDRWAVFSLDRCQALTLRGVTATLENEERGQPAAFIEIAREPMNALSMMSETDDTRVSAAIDINESILRGEADVIASRVADPATINIAWTAIASSGSLFRVDLMQRRSMMSAEERATSIALDHVTAVLDQPLVSITTDRSRPPLVSVAADDCLIAIRRADKPVIAMTGDEDQDLWVSRFEWRGHGNVFHTTGPLWEIASSPGSAPSLTMPFKDWPRFVTSSTSEQLLTAPPFESAELSSTQRVSGISASNFTLRTGTGSIQDRFGRPIGVDVSRIPDLAADPQ